MSRTIRALLLLVLSLTACGGGQGTSAPPTVAPGPAPSTFEGSGTLGAAGGTITLAGVARITFPAGSLREGTLVRVYQASTPTAEEDFSDALAMFGVQDYLPTALVVQVSGGQPTAPVAITMTVPASFASPAADRNIVVLGSITNVSEYEGPIPTWDTPGAGAPNAASISFEARPSFFSRSNADGLAIFFLTRTTKF